MKPMPTAVQNIAHSRTIHQRWRGEQTHYSSIAHNIRGHSRRRDTAYSLMQLKMRPLRSTTQRAATPKTTTSAPACPAHLFSTSFPFHTRKKGPRNGFRARPPTVATLTCTAKENSATKSSAATPQTHATPGMRHCTKLLSRVALIPEFLSRPAQGCQLQRLPPNSGHAITTHTTNTPQHKHAITHEGGEPSAKQSNPNLSWRLSHCLHLSSHRPPQKKKNGETRGKPPLYRARNPKYSSEILGFAVDVATISTIV